jgi:hypothetical protein
VPSFGSIEASLYVIAFVLLSDAQSVLLWLFVNAFQPFQSFEDNEKLAQLKKTDPDAWNLVLKQMVEKHYARGPIARLLFRPKLPRL